MSVLRLSEMAESDVAVCQAEQIAHFNPDLRADLWPDPDCVFDWVLLSTGDVRMAEDCAVGIAQRDCAIAPVLARYGTWLVTEFGIECLEHPYQIPISRLGEGDLKEHMAEKKWVSPLNFNAALAFARGFHLRATRSRIRKPSHTPCPPARKKPRGVGLRFRILRRDGYRCRLCGATADEGARLEVDHRQPKSRGGSNDESNLWTLCWECNRGKSNQPLVVDALAGN